MATGASLSTDSRWPPNATRAGSLIHAGRLLVRSRSIVQLLAATRPGSWIDQLCRLVTTAGVSLPVFFTGLLLSFVFYFLLGWAPSPLGRIDPYVSAPPTITGFYLIDSALAGDGAAFVSSARQLILPALTLALFVMAPVARHDARPMLGVLSADFVRTARAMGLSRMRVLYGYAFQNALLPSGPRSVWCSRSCSAPMCWSRRCSPGRASDRSRSSRWWPATMRPSRASC
jgi:ABC-type antimicrobial peptide transport system permease subunit